MKINYQSVMQRQIQTITDKSRGSKPSLLLHACCAPCSSAVLARLIPVFAVSLYYYNPNIHPDPEYRRRLQELRTFVSRCPQTAGIPVVEAPYIPEDYYTATQVRNQRELQTEPEMGERCFRCYRFRMQKAYTYAIQNRFDFFTTTLSVSPHKDSEKINAIGRDLDLQFRQEQGVDIHTAFLYADFKKQNGYQRSLQLSAEYGLYRQDYCGCEFSFRRLPIRSY
jgi:predicted adenine nucleotide alpha hydrolase (AANH) superfamily ATPase